MDLVTKLSSWTDHIGDMDGPYHDTKTRCYVHIAGPAQLCLRANTITDYYEANKQVMISQHSNSLILSKFISTYNDNSLEHVSFTH